MIDELCGNFTQKERALIRNHSNVYVRRGLLPRKPCAVCGSSAELEKHHFDYSRPVEIIWLCKAHHRAIHRGEISCEGLEITTPNYKYRVKQLPARIPQEIKERRVNIRRALRHERQRRIAERQNASLA